MKRLFLLAATAAVLATSCEKHEIRNEVINEIGFTSNVGKQTKAIINAGDTYTADFGVYAYGPDQSTTDDNKVMTNVVIKKGNDDKWAAADGNKYYWPNSDKTELRFYAYSPYMATGSSCGTTNGVALTNYVHSDKYLDFMVATPVAEATFEKPYGDTEAPASVVNGTVPVRFNHQMTQLKFRFKTHTYKGITFTVKTIKLVDAADKADYDWKNKWSNQAIANTTSNVDVFPITGETAKGVGYAAEIAEVFTTTPITVIPQTITDKAYIVINYTISGEGVATETVEKKVYLNSNTVITSWDVNKVVIYNISFNMREILFAPEVNPWDTPEVEGGLTVVA